MVTPWKPGSIDFAGRERYYPPISERGDHQQQGRTAGRSSAFFIRGGVRSGTG